jgi:hypothetical protein
MGLGSSHTGRSILSNEGRSQPSRPGSSSPKKIPEFEGDNKLTEPIPISSPVGSPPHVQSIPSAPLFHNNSASIPGPQAVPTIFRWTGGGQQVFLALLGPVAHGRVVPSLPIVCQQTGTLSTSNTNNFNDNSLTSLLTEAAKDGESQSASSQQRTNQNVEPSSSQSFVSSSSVGNVSFASLAQSEVPWSDWLPMVPSDSEHLLICNLSPGVYLFRFCVDGRVRHDPNQRAAQMMEYLTTHRPITSYVNVIEVQPPTNDYNKNGVVSESPEGTYGQNDIDFEVTPSPLTASPPTNSTHTQLTPLELPVYLERALLNTQQTRAWRPTSFGARSVTSPLSLSLSLSPTTTTPSVDTTESLPLPHHVMLNHLYARSVTPDVRVLGLSVRYKEKFVTVVFYTPTRDTPETATDSETDDINSTLSKGVEYRYPSFTSFESPTFHENEFNPDLGELSG